MVCTDGRHLVAGTIEELHEFARRIGLRKRWFQDHRHPHYDLTTRRMAARAEAAGAIRVANARRLIEVLQDWRANGHDAHARVAR